MRDLKAQLETLAEDVLDNTIEPKVGAILNQINTRVRLIEVERKIRETEDLAREVEELSEAFERQQEKNHGT